MHADMPDGDTFGPRHVEMALRDLEFPMTTLELRDRAGKWRIPITGARFVRLADLLEPLDADHVFAGPEDVAKAVKERTRGR